MNEAKIRIAYDGEALRSGAMSVRDLAPALMALSDLFEETNKVINDKDSAVQLRVQADFRAGSFDVCVQIHYTWATKILHMFAGENASGLANLLGILGLSTTGTVIGLIALIRWIRGRKVQRIDIIDNDNMRVIVDGDHIDITKYLASVFVDVAVRRALAALFEPLRREGIDTFEVRATNGEVIEQVKDSELALFEPPEPEQGAREKVSSNVLTQAFTLVSVSFREGNKWRVSDGQNTISVSVEDAKFLALVNVHEESFSKDDTILCKVRQEQTIGPGGDLKTESAIVEVIKHQHAPRQTIIKFPEPEPPEDPSS